MIANKYIGKICLVLVLAALVICFVCVSGIGTEVFAKDSGMAMEYESKLFDTDKVIEIDIIMDQDTWRTMLDTASEEVYYECDVVVNGTRFSKVGIRPKGNTSLSSIASDPDNDRYSFKLEFDQFVKSQTCFGLDKLVLNNSYADATYIKEAVIYDMFAYLDADASLYNYAKLSVNGEYFGAYLALEAVEDSFMLRNYGTEKGYIYKPDGMNFGGGGGFGGGMGGGSNLNYTDDNLDSYGSIWNNAKSDSEEKDHKRVVEALKNISTGTDLEKYMNVENVLKYAAAHIFAVNDDSLSGNMTHNYYLYESGGRLNILPWDYNLAFGGMNGNNATNMVNDPIDYAFAGTRFFDKLLENPEYKAIYHSYLKKLAEEYVQGGKLDALVEKLSANIDGLVETDPNALYTYEEYLAAKDTLVKVIKLRGESVSGQVNGTIPSTSEGQRTDSSSLVDASGISLSSMGSFMGGRGGFGGRETNRNTEGAEGEAGAPPQFGGNAGGNFGGNMGERPTGNRNGFGANGEAMTIPEFGNGEGMAMPGGENGGNMNGFGGAAGRPVRNEDGSFTFPTDGSLPTNGNAPMNENVPTGENAPMGGNVPMGGNFGGNFGGAQNGEVRNGENGRQNGQFGMMPGGFGGEQGGMGGFGGNFGGRSGMMNTQPEKAKTFMDIVKENATPIISMVLLGAAFIFVIFYKRKKF